MPLPAPESRGPFPSSSNTPPRLWATSFRFSGAARRSSSPTATARRSDTWGAVVVVNATAESLKGLIIRAAIAGQHALETPVPIIPPLSARKVGFQMRGKAPGSGDTAPVALTLLAGRGQVLHSATAKLRIRRSDQTQKRTFLSEIDGSVQYWALNPAQPIGRTSPPPALFLSVHGASVEAIGQADAYSPKRD